MNRAKFFDTLRSRGKPFGKSINARQVEGIEALLDAGAKKQLPLPHVANVLAQVKRETGGIMFPIKETVRASHKDQNPSDAEVIRRLDSAFAKGQLPWVKKPYWRTGWFGRGQIQPTHEVNYRKASALTGIDLVKNPGRALEPAVSAMIAVGGMESGIFTSKKLSDFDGARFDHAGARAVVNGDKNMKDKGGTMTVGQQIAADALAFEAALEAGGWGSTITVEEITKPSTLWDFIKSLFSF